MPSKCTRARARTATGFARPYELVPRDSYFVTFPPLFRPMHMSQLPVGCSAVVLVCFTCPAITVVSSDNIRVHVDVPTLLSAPILFGTSVEHEC